MPFKFSAFLSYRHSKESFGNRFVEDFYKLLAAELELRVGEPVFYDRNVFADTPFSEQALAQALAESVCLLFVFTPMLFDESRPYCAMEYRAMEVLEKQRLAFLPADQQHHGLLFPIILRGRETVPEEIYNTRQFIDFSDFVVSARLTRSAKYTTIVKQLADYISDRCMVFRTLSRDAFSDATSFALPDREQTISWIQRLAPTRSQAPRL